jgi:hypothetical protein
LRFASKARNEETENTKTPLQDEAPLSDYYAEDAAEAGKKAFYENTDFPAGQGIWDAHLLAYQLYLSQSTLYDDYRHLLYHRNCLFPAKILGKHAADSFDMPDSSAYHIPPSIIKAALLWRVLKDQPALGTQEEDIFDNATLDIAYELIDYEMKRTPFSGLSEEAQSVVTALQIVTLSQQNEHLENWKYKLFAKKIHPEDVQHGRDLYQQLLTEKQSDDSTKLGRILEEQLQRFGRTLGEENPMRVPQSAKKHIFKVVPGMKRK